MKLLSAFLTIVVLLGLGGTTARGSSCNIADAQLEEAILNKPEFRQPASRQMVRDLRSLRDAAFILWSYGRHADCERLVANIRELVFAPSMGALGENDEDEADQQIAALDPIIREGGAIEGRRNLPGAQPLISINQMVPGLRANEIIGTEVRSSDDKIIGEVRNIVFGTEDRWDYAIVASGGFFTIGKDSFVVPIRYLNVSQQRESFYLRISEAKSKEIPLMPDYDYEWLSDKEWRARNDDLFR